MRAPRPAPAPYTPKRALNSGSSAGAAAALGIQKLAGKNDLFAFSSAFLTGYLAGIPLGRFELHGAFTSLTEHVKVIRHSGLSGAVGLPRRFCRHR